MADYDVIVIGAGCGGLCAGALLSKQGRKVLVLEQSSRIGGCCSTFERDGFHFDVGASIVEVIKPIEMTFEKLGTSLQKEIDLIACDPIMSVVFRDGSRVTYPLSIEGTAEVIRQIAPEDVEGWYGFVDFMSELNDVSLDTFFVMPADNMGDLLRMVQKDRRLIKFLPTFLASYQDVMQKYFKSDKVLKTMGYQSLYIGLPPALVPGPFAMIPYSEHRGVYYPRGGMVKIPEALERCGARLGMETRLNARVQKVLVYDGRAQGVVLADGTEISAKVVVSDVNAKMLYLDMIGQEKLPPLAAAGVKSYAYSKSVPMVYVGVDYEPDLASHHSLIGVTPDGVNRYWWDYVEKGRLMEENIGLICWPTHSDPSLAPEGHHVLNLIPEGFYHLKGTDWDSEKPRFIERTLKYLDSFAVPGLLDHVKVVDCATPLDFERELMLPEGAIYALQQDLAAAAMFRPAARSKSIRGLYLTGSSTHPGGGVPTTIASGYIASNLIEQYEQ